MDEPDNATQLPIGTVWIQEGIVIHRANDANRTRESVGGLFAVIRELFDGAPGPVLFDAREWQGTDPDVWQTAITNLESTVTRAAMLVDPASVEIGPYPDVIDRRLIPFGIFTDEAKALAFLRMPME